MGLKRFLTTKCQACFQLQLSYFRMKWQIQSNLLLILKLSILISSSSITVVSSSSEEIAFYLIKVVKAYEVQIKRECVILALNTELPMTILSERQVVTLSNPENDLDLWMREDGHGTKFDTGCTVIVTKGENLNRQVERKFKNMIWILLDRLPKNEKLEVDHPVVDMYLNIVSVHCPYSDTTKVSFYDRYD